MSQLFKDEAAAPLKDGGVSTPVERFRAGKACDECWLGKGV
jgi:hypothetical protein